MSEWALGFSPDGGAALEEPGGLKPGHRTRSDTPAPSPVLTIELSSQFRDPETKFWRCTNERAQAQAVAREAEHLLAGGIKPEEDLRAC